jgi:DNA repair protein RecO (recombination protein O)
MEERAHGIILRTRLLTETSLIVQWLTAEAGRISTVAKGARRNKSPFAGKLDLYYEADFSFQRARKSSLHSLRELSLKATRASLRTELAALEMAARAGRWIEKMTEEETPLPEVFELFRAFLDEVANGPLNQNLGIVFEVRLLEMLGLAPELSRLKAGSARALEQLARMDWEAVRRVKLSVGQFEELASLLESGFREGMR